MIIKIMRHNEFDNEYYVMDSDGADNHPLLEWGSTSYAPFRKKIPIEDGQLELPLKIVFDEPYPAKYEMADFLTLGSLYAVSEKLKSLFESKKIYGIQFFPIEIETDKGDTVLGHFALHFWNRIAAIDKSTFEGKIDPIGLATNYSRFSLDEKLLEDTSLENRLAIRLKEAPNIILVHQTIYDAIEAEGLTGISFRKVSEWTTGSAFR